MISILFVVRTPANTHTHTTVDDDIDLYIRILSTKISIERIVVCIESKKVRNTKKAVRLPAYTDAPLQFENIGFVFYSKLNMLLAFLFCFVLSLLLRRLSAFRSILRAVEQVVQCHLFAVAIIDGSKQFIQLNC